MDIRHGIASQATLPRDSPSHQLPTKIPKVGHTLEVVIAGYKSATVTQIVMVWPFGQT